MSEEEDALHSINAGAHWYLYPCSPPRSTWRLPSSKTLMSGGNMELEDRERVNQINFYPATIQTKRGGQPEERQSLHASESGSFVMKKADCYSATTHSEKWIVKPEDGQGMEAVVIKGGKGWMRTWRATVEPRQRRLSFSGGSQSQRTIQSLTKKYFLAFWVIWPCPACSSLFSVH